MTTPTYLVYGGVGVVAAASLTYMILRLTSAHGILDIPNSRSSHLRPTPRGGGGALVITVIGAELVLGLRGLLDVRAVVALAGGGAVIGILGAWDDIHSISARSRLIIQLAAAIGAILALSDRSTFSLGGSHYPLSAGVGAVAAIAIVWATNLYNFMDGTDGIAGVQSAVAGTAAAFVFARASLVPLALVATVVAGASIGFLLFNWSPARIFLGDVGSGFLGYTFAVLALSGDRMGGVPGVWIVLPVLPFILDSTVTLFRRVLRGHSPLEAHRDHLYQRAVRQKKSHRIVASWYGAVAALLGVAAWFGAANVTRFWPVLLFSVGVSSVIYCIAWRATDRRA